jgi:RNA polymerase sigma factor (sigma-70 family)
MPSPQGPHSHARPSGAPTQSPLPSTSDGLARDTCPLDPSIVDRLEVAHGEPATRDSRAASPASGDQSHPENTSVIDAEREARLQDCLGMTWSEAAWFVKKYARGYLKLTLSDADDLVQEVMLSAWRWAERRPGTTVDNPKGFLLQAANNRWKDHHRNATTQRRGGKNVRHETLDARFDVADPAPNRFDHVEQAVTLEQQLAYVPNLAQRDALRLYAQGWTTNEASLELGVNPSTYKSRVKKAGEALRQALAGAEVGRP